MCDLFLAPTDSDSKNSQVKQENDENDPSNVDNERVLVKTDDPDYIYGNEDIAMEDDPMDTDYNQLKRGFRKRITTKRQKALLETKRKRGRPPIKVGPIGNLRDDSCSVESQKISISHYFFQIVQTAEKRLKQPGIIASIVLNIPIALHVPKANVSKDLNPRKSLISTFGNIVEKNLMYARNVTNRTPSDKICDYT